MRQQQSLFSIAAIAELLETFIGNAIFILFIAYVPRSLMNTLYSIPPITKSFSNASIAMLAQSIATTAWVYGGIISPDVEYLGILVSKQNIVFKTLSLAIATCSSLFTSLSLMYFQKFRFVPSSFTSASLPKSGLILTAIAEFLTSYFFKNTQVPLLILAALKFADYLGLEFLMAFVNQTIIITLRKWENRFDNKVAMFVYAMCHFGFQAASRYALIGTTGGPFFSVGSALLIFTCGKQFILVYLFSIVILSAQYLAYRLVSMNSTLDATKREKVKIN